MILYFFRFISAQLINVMYLNVLHGAAVGTLVSVSPQHFFSVSTKPSFVPSLLSTLLVFLCFFSSLTRNSAGLRSSVPRLAFSPLFCFLPVAAFLTAFLRMSILRVFYFLALSAIRTPTMLSKLLLIEFPKELFHATHSANFSYLIHLKHLLVLV
jgi:hypothetical protein